MNSKQRAFCGTALAVALLACASMVSAQTTATSTATSGSSSEATANGGGGGAGGAASIGNLSAGASVQGVQGGAASVTGISTGASTSNVGNVSTGPASASVGSVSTGPASAAVSGVSPTASVNQTFQAAKAQPSAMIPVVVAPATPQIFTEGRFTAPGAAALLYNAFSESCSPQEIAFGDMRGDIEPGFATIVNAKGKKEYSQVATLTWTPLPGLREQAEFAQANNLPLSQPSRLATAFPNNPQAHIICLMTVTASSTNKDVDSMMLRGIIADKLFGKLSVFKKRVYVVSAAEAQSAASGVHTDGKGAGAGIGTSSLFSGLTSLVGLNVGVANTKGDATPFDNVGGGYIVFMTSDDDESGAPVPLGSTLNPAMFTKQSLVADYHQPVQSVTGGAGTGPTAGPTTIAPNQAVASGVTKGGGQ